MLELASAMRHGSSSSWRTLQKARCEAMASMGKTARGRDGTRALSQTSVMVACDIARDRVAVGSAREQKSSTLSRLTSAHRARDSLAVASVERVHDHTSAADKAPATNPMPPIDAGTCVAVAPAIAAIE